MTGERGVLVGLGVRVGTDVGVGVQVGVGVGVDVAVGVDVGVGVCVGVSVGIYVGVSVGSGCIMPSIPQPIAKVKKSTVKNRCAEFLKSLPLYLCRRSLAPECFSYG